MALRLVDLRPQDKWDEETTWEEVAAKMDPPMPQAWIRGLKSTDPGDASYTCPTPADFWRKYWKPESRLWGDWSGIQSCLWTRLNYVTFGDPDCYYGKEGNVGSYDTDPRISQIIALLAGLDANTDLNSAPTCTVSSPFDRTRTEQRLETLDYNTTQTDWDIQELQERLNSVKERTTTLEKKAARKRYQQERAQQEQEKREQNAEALKRVEPVLSVVMMVPELTDGGMHGIMKVPWSQVQGKNGKAIFEFQGVNYELRRNKFNSTGYTGHALESDWDEGA